MKKKYNLIFAVLIVSVLMLSMVSAGWLSNLFKQKEEVKEQVKINNFEYPKAPIFHEVYFPTIEYGWVKEVGVFGEEGVEVYYERYGGEE